MLFKFQSNFDRKNSPKIKNSFDFWISQYCDQKLQPRKLIWKHLKQTIIITAIKEFAISFHTSTRISIIFSTFSRNFVIITGKISRFCFTSNGHRRFTFKRSLRFSFSNTTVNSSDFFSIALVDSTFWILLLWRIEAFLSVFTY